MLDGRLLRGVWPILVTPFDENGAVDQPSLTTLVEGTLTQGVDGVVALGVNAEASKLSDAERVRILETVAEVCRSTDRPFLVTVSHPSTPVAVERARAAGEAGAAGVMAAPPPFARPGPALVDHFRAIGEVGLPVVVQDYPPETAVHLTAELLAEMVRACGPRAGVKVEDPPTPLKIARLRALVGDDVGLVGGIGAMYLLSELRHGGDGAMTGFPLPAGDESAAEATYRQWLPLMVLAGQPGLGLAVIKEVLRRRGLIRNAALRRPGTTLDEITRRELDRILEAVPR
jgi:4-hydroxy-tetrahydrodipicolinate synthase